MTEPTDDTLQAMMLAMLHAANNSEGYAAVQQYGIGPGGDAEMRAVFRVVQDALAAQGAEPVAWQHKPDRPGAILVLSHMSPDEAMAWNDIAESRPLYYHPPPAAQPAPATEPLGLTGGGHSVAGAPGWIACAERMPPDGDEVVAAWPDTGDPYKGYGCVSTAVYSQRCGWTDGDGLTLRQDVTHWQPLPPPLDAAR